MFALCQNPDVALDNITHWSAAFLFEQCINPLGQRGVTVNCSANQSETSVAGNHFVRFFDFEGLHVDLFDALFEFEGTHGQ